MTRIVLKLEDGRIYPAHPLPKGITIAVRDYDILERRPEDGPGIRVDNKERRYIQYEMGTGPRTTTYADLGAPSQQKKPNANSI